MSYCFQTKPGAAHGQLGSERLPRGVVQCGPYLNHAILPSIRRGSEVQNDWSHVLAAEHCAITDCFLL